MPTPGSAGRKVLIALGVVAGAVVLLVALLLVIVNSGAATRRVVELVLPSVSTALGREVTVRDAKLKVLPGARVTLVGLQIAGRPGEPALVDADSLDVQVALWPLIRSLGKEVEVDAITLVRPTINLVKARNGTWSFEGLGAASPAGKERAGRPVTPPPAAAQPGSGERVAVDAVRIEQATIRVVDRTTGTNDAGIAVTQLDLEAHGVGPGLPLQARLAAALADRRQNLEARLSVARLPSAIPQRPEDWPEVKGSLVLRALALDAVKALFPGGADAIVRGGTASLDATLSTAGGTYRVDGRGELRDVQLRGQAASGRFHAVAAWSPAKPDAARLDLTELAIRGPGVDLGGVASVQTAPVRATFALAGPLLDLDAVMGILPEKAPGPPPKERAEPAGGEVLPDATRRQVQAATASGTVSVDKLRGGRLEATDVKARATLSRGTLTLEQLDAAAYGGRVSATGTKVSLGESVPSWTLAATLAGLDLEKAIGAFAGRSPLVGKVNGTLHTDGKGTDWSTVREALSGLVALGLKDGTLTTADLGASVLGGVAKALEAAGKGGAAKRIAGAGGKTTLRDLAGKFTVKDGFLAAQSPLRFGSSAGDFSLGGRVGLDGRLELEGTAIVPRKVLAEVVSGLPLPDRLEVPLAIGGTLEAPSISIRGDQAVASLFRGQAQQAVQGAREKAERQGRKAVEGLFDRFKRK